MRQNGEELVLDAVGVLMRGALAQQPGAFRLRMLTLGEIANRRDDDLAVGQPQRARADVDRKVRTVLPPRVELVARTQFARPNETDRVGGPWSVLKIAQEELDPLVLHSLAGIAEQPVGGGVREQNAAPPIHDEHGIGQDLENLCEVPGRGSDRRGESVVFQRHLGEKQPRAHYSVGTGPADALERVNARSGGKIRETTATSGRAARVKPDAHTDVRARHSPITERA